MNMLELSREEKLKAIEHHFAKIMQALGLDLTEPSLAKTPERVAKMYVDEFFAGLDPENFPKMTYFDPPDTDGKLVLIRDIAVESICEHHFVPMSGKAHIAYLPKKKILGLSKIPRLVNYFCKRPQVQERLTPQIADALVHLLETEDIAVRIEAKHYCIAMRGIKDTSSLTITQDLRGKFRTDLALAQQFLSLSQ
jgi:GTP cyclohydrolase I